MTRAKAARAARVSFFILLVVIGAMASGLAAFAIVAIALHAAGLPAWAGAPIAGIAGCWAGVFGLLLVEDWVKS